MIEWRDELFKRLVNGGVTISGHAIYALQLKLPHQQMYTSTSNGSLGAENFDTDEEQQRWDPMDVRLAINQLRFSSASTKSSVVHPKFKTPRKEFCPMRTQPNAEYCRVFPSGLIILLQPYLLSDVNTGTGGDVWLGSHSLALLLTRHPSICANKTLLELGAGTGYLGLTASLLGATLTMISDRANTIPLIARNIKENASLLSSGTTCVPLELDWAEVAKRTEARWTSVGQIWTEKSEPVALDTILCIPSVDVVVAADVLYSRSDKRSLLAVLRYLLQANPRLV